MAFPVVTYGCESWTVKKAECQKIDVFKLWFWRRLLKAPWKAGRSNLSIFFFSPNFLLFLLFVYFNWRLITLQYCSGFCHTFTWISHGWTCAPHPEPQSHIHPHPISQGHASAPALSTLSYIKPGPVIYFTYDNIHVSMLFSQIIPLSPSLT